MDKTDKYINPSSYIIIAEVFILVDGTSGAETHGSHAGGRNLKGGAKRSLKTDLKHTMRSGFWCGDQESMTFD